MEALRSNLTSLQGFTSHDRCLSFFVSPLSAPLYILCNEGLCSNSSTLLVLAICSRGLALARFPVRVYLLRTGCTLHPRTVASTPPTLYILAQEYKIKDLTDAAMDYIGNCYALTDTLPSRAEIHQVVDKSPLDSKLRKYMTMACLYILSSPSYTTGVENVLPTADLWFLGSPLHPGYGFLCQYYGHDANPSFPARGKRFKPFLTRHSLS